MVVHADDRRAAAARALTRARAGFGLLTGYYVAALVVMVVTAAVFPHQADYIILAGLVAGLALLIAVSAGYRRSRKALRERWPDLAPAGPGPGEPDLGRTVLGKPRTRTMQPYSGVAGVFYVLALTGLAALAAVAADAANAAKASTRTEVTILNCTQNSHGEQSCAAAWRADGRVYRGRITWSSGDPNPAAGVYDPSRPGVVYSAGDRFLDGTTVLGLLWFVLWGLIGLVILFFNIRSRRPYLAALRGASANSELARLRPLS
jgi:hypothetical protein